MAVGRFRPAQAAQEAAGAAWGATSAAAGGEGRSAGFLRAPARARTFRQRRGSVSAAPPRAGTPRSVVGLSLPQVVRIRAHLVIGRWRVAKAKAAPNVAGPYPGANGPIGYCHEHCVWLFWSDRECGCFICRWEATIAAHPAPERS